MLHIFHACVICDCHPDQDSGRCVHVGKTTVPGRPRSGTLCHFPPFNFHYVSAGDIYCDADSARTIALSCAAVGRFAPLPARDASATLSPGCLRICTSGAPIPRVPRARKCRKPFDTCLHCHRGPSTTSFPGRDRCGLGMCSTSEGTYK